jgi:hypothetical protein
MKKILFIFISLINLKAFCYDAVVIVFEAPLLKKADYKSKVVATLRKGEHLFVPNTEADLEPLPEFISTFDKSGSELFVPSQYIKIVYNDSREENSPIAFKGKDPTDYRIEEPIPKTYPYSDINFLRAGVAYTMGTNMKSPYEYNSPLREQRYSTEQGARLTLMRKLDIDKADRYYFGLFSAVNTVNNTITFKNSVTVASENRSTIRVGPVFSYDVYKTYLMRVTMLTGFTYNYHKSTIDSRGDLQAYEQRIFSGYSFSPMAELSFTKTEILPVTDVIGGMNLSMYLPHSQKTSDAITVPEIWNTTADQINSSLKLQASIFLGFQVRY